MAKKSYTILVVPHARAKFRKFQLTSVQLLASASLLALLLVGTAFVAWSVLTDPIDSHEVSRLEQENGQLREVNRSFEESLRRMQAQLTEYEDRTRRLAIVAGLEETGPGESGLGGELALGADGGELLAALDERAGAIDRQLDEVADTLDARVRWISSVPSISPTRGLFTSGFGPRRDPITGKPSYHQGIDISAPAGKPVQATADGIVVKSGRIAGLGNAVYLAHGYGLTTRYGHLSETTVRPGQRVKRGDLVGYVGNTGRSTGYHLHYEVLRDGKRVDPLAHILDRN